MKPLSTEKKEKEKIQTPVLKKVEVNKRAKENGIAGKNKENRCEKRHSIK